MKADETAGLAGRCVLSFRGRNVEQQRGSRFEQPSGPRRYFSTVAAVALLVWSSPVLAAPQGSTVVSGTATVSSAGATTNVNQSTNKAIINWQSFSVGATETVNFNQPSAASATLNRVVGNEKSVIEGALNANGQVFLVNSAGVLIGKGASVNTAGFVASTLDITNDNFNAGNYVFSGTSSADVINLGTITATDGGYVVLMGKTVSNQGVIQATKGTVALASGDQITLNFNGDSLVSVSVDQGTLDALVENKQAIYADGGKVILTAKAADDLLSAQVNNGGLIQARTIGDLKGDISLHAYNGTTNVAGTLDASAPNGGDGGAIETSGDKVKVADSAIITTKSTYGTTGMWTIDPTDFTIAASGGDITGALLGDELALSSITLASTMGTSGTSGNIYVNDTVTWSAGTALTLTAANSLYVNAAITANDTANATTGAGLTLTATGGSIYDNAAITLNGAHDTLTLSAGSDINIDGVVSMSGSNAATTLNATNNININSSITATGTSAGLVLNYGGYATKGSAASGTNYNIGSGASVILSGSSATLTINGKAYTLVQSMSELPATIASGIYFALGQDLTAGTATNAVITTLSGTLAGMGHTISYLTITGSTGKEGLIGTNSGTVRDLGLVDVTVSDTNGDSFIGSLVGLSSGTILNCYATGTVTGTYAVGGLVGDNSTGTITNSHADVSVSGTSNAGKTVQYVGGLVGANYGTITNSYATGDVSAAGLVTSVTSGTTVSYTVSYAQDIGGLVGSNSKLSTTMPGVITGSYATGNVTTTDSNNVGGLVGKSTGTISNSYETGNVSDTSSVSDPSAIGGLVGWNTGTISNVMESGTVTVTVNAGSADNVGGLVGLNSGSISNATANGEVKGVGSVSFVGGFVGYNSVGTISNSTANGQVQGGAYVGGFAGSNTGTITGSTENGNVTSTVNSDAGGFVGDNGGTISGSTAYGSVTGEGIIGGFAGTNGGKLANDTAYGDLNGVGNAIVGGLVGDNLNGTVTDSSAFGSGASGWLGRNDGGTVSNVTYDDVKADAAAAAAQAAAQAAAEAAAQAAAQAAAEAAAQAAAQAAAEAAAQATLHARMESAVTQGSAVASAVTTASVAPALSIVPTGTKNSGSEIGSHITDATSSGSSGYIQNIEVDGVRYNLENSGSGGNAGSTTGGSGSTGTGDNSGDDKKKQ